MSPKTYSLAELEEALPPLQSEEGEEHKQHESEEENQEPPVLLNDYCLKVWKGEVTVEKENGEDDRSASLLNIGRVVYEAGGTRETVVRALKERDATLGWHKYTDRGDDKRYYEIWDKLEKAGRNNVNPLDSQGEEPSTRRSSYKDRVPLHEIIENGVPEPEELVPGILLKGKVHHLYAEAGCGKSWVSLGVAREVMKQGGTVVYLDKENWKRTMAERVNSLDIPADMVEERFYYLEDPPSATEKEVRKDFEEMLDEEKPSLLIFDAWIGFLTDADLNENESRDIQRWASAYLHPARKREITVLVLDHVPHDARRSRGSGRKKEEVDVQWELSSSEDFDRSKVGLVKLFRKKDREGWLPPKVAYRLGGEDGEFVFERVEQGKNDDLTAAQRKVLKVLEDKFQDGAKDGEWKKACQEYEEVSESTYYDAKKKLKAKDRVEKRKDKYYPVDPPDSGIQKY